MITVDIDVKKPPTPEQIKMIENAKQMPITYDEDSPELTDEQLKKFEKASDPKYYSNTNQIVTLQLSPKTFEKAKSRGNDYTVILSRIIENVLNDNEMIEHFL